MEVRNIFNERLRRIADQADTEEFQQSFHIQAEAVVHIQRSWGSMTPKEQDRVAEELGPKIPRCQASPDPVMCFKQLVVLPEEEDVNRALLVRPELYENWVGETHEQIYPETGWLGHYIRYAKHNQVPLAFHFWAGVAVLGAACRRNFFLDRRIFKIYLGHYMILTGPKATGKSIAAETAIDILNRLNRSLEDSSEYQVTIFPEDTTQEYLIKALSEINQKRAHHEESGLVSLKTVDACGILHCDELSNFLGKQTFAVSKKVPFLTSIAFKDSYSKGTSTEGRVDIKNLAMSILACSAPEWMRDTIYGDAMAGGFMDRCLFVYRDPVRCRTYPPTSELPALDPLQAEILARYMLPLTRPKNGQKTMLELTQEADEWLGDWYRKERESEMEKDSPRVKSLDRRVYQILRLAAVLSISENEMPWVGLPRIQAARKIVDSEDVFYEQFLASATERGDAQFYDDILLFIKKNGGRAQRYEITQRFKRNIGPASIVQGYLETLVASRELSLYQSKGGDLFVIPG